MFEMFRAAILYHVVVLLVVVTRVLAQSYESCAVTPVSYFYKEGSFTHIDTLSSSCQSSVVQMETFLTCSQASIRDGNRGPANFSEAAPEDYYNWTRSGSQIAFNFTQNISFTRIKVYYYVNREPDLALPKLRFLQIDGGVLPDCDARVTTDIIDRSIDSIAPDQVTLGRHMQQVSVTGSADALLMCILLTKNYRLALTEIEFCSNDSIQVTTSSSQSPPQVSNIDIHSTQHSTQETVAPSQADSDQRLLIGVPVGSILGLIIVVLVAAMIIIVIVKYVSREKSSSKISSPDKNTILTAST